MEGAVRRLNSVLPGGEEIFRLDEKKLLTRPRSQLSYNAFPDRGGNPVPRVFRDTRRAVVACRSGSRGHVIGSKTRRCPVLKEVGGPFAARFPKRLHCVLEAFLPLPRLDAVAGGGLFKHEAVGRRCTDGLKRLRVRKCVPDRFRGVFSCRLSWNFLQIFFSPPARNYPRGAVFCHVRRFFRREKNEFFRAVRRF